MNHRNTYKNGILTFYFYPTADKTFVVACEELCLLREGRDPEHTKLCILADAKKYVENVSNNKLGEHLLNQTLPDEIKKEFNAYRQKIKNEMFEKWSVTIKDLMAKRGLTCA